MKYFAISDIHSFYSIAKEALDKADKYIPIIEKWADEAPEKHTEFSFSMLDDALYGVLKYATKEEFEDETE